MGTTADPAFAHTPLFTRPAGKKTRGRPAGHRLTRAGVVVLAFLRAQSSTTIQQLATKINVPASTLRKVLRGDDGMSGARIERLLRSVSPSRRTEIFQKIPQHILHELIDGAGVLDVKTEVESKAVWRSTSGKPIPVHVQLDQLTVTANVVKMKGDVPSLWKWLGDWLPGGPRASWAALETAERAGQRHLVVRRGGPKKKEGLAYVDMPYRTVFDIVVFDRQRHGEEPILARIGIGRLALCRRHAWKLRNARVFSLPVCASCVKKSSTKPQHCLRIEGGGFASGLAPTIAHTFFVPFTRPGSVWVAGYHLALDAELPITNVVAVPRAVGRRGFRVVTAYADTGIEDDSPLITQPNEGMVTGLYFGGKPSPIVIYDKSERLALGHGARPCWLRERDAQMRARHGMHHDDVKFTRIELRLRLRDGNPEGLLAREAPGLLSRILVADKGALFADGLRALLLDELAYEGLLGHEEVTRVRFKGRPQPVVMKPFWKHVTSRVAARMRGAAPTSTTTAEDAADVTEVARGIVEGVANVDRLDLEGALAAALPQLQAELDALLQTHRPVSPKPKAKAKAKPKPWLGP